MQKFNKFLKYALLKDSCTDKKYFHIKNRSNIDHIFVDFIQNIVVFIKISNKTWFPHDANWKSRYVPNVPKG